MTTTKPMTPFDKILPEDVMPGFDPNEPPDPAPFWDSEAMEPSEEWNQLRLLWTRVKAYHRLHSSKFIPISDAYEIPRPARAWADKIMAGGSVKPLLLSGAVGVGKTHGAAALACYLAAFWDRQLYTSAPAVAFHTASLLLGGLKNFGSPEQREALYHSVANAKVLVVDDLTRTKITDFDMESLGQVVDERLGKQLPTIMTLNHGPSVALSDLVPAFLASRLEAGQQVVILGTDRRA